jgi:subtilase family serine protease
MRSARSWVALAAAGLAVSAAAVAAGAPAATAAGGSHHRQTAISKHPKALERSKPAGKVSPSSRVSFDLVLSMRHANKARRLASKVSTPGSSRYRHYLSDAKWEKKFSPRHARVHAARSWLRKHGFRAGAPSTTHLFLPASGSARKVERAFSTKLGYYKVNGQTVRLAKSKVEVPNAIAGSVSGIVGVNQHIAMPQIAMSGATPAAGGPAAAEPPPPAAFVNPQPCSASWGKTIDTKDSSKLYAPYTPKRPYDICGYTPTQLRGGYGINSSLVKGIDGKGVSIAIVDAYDSPTLLADAQKYSSLNDPSHPLKASQFVDDNPGSVNQKDACAASGWYAEQALDVESSHAMAPGAKIIFVGGKNCFDPAFMAGEEKAITSGASVVSNSWLEVLGDIFDDTATRQAYDNLFMMAADTGVSVTFSSGDDGDNFADFGIAAPDYPASSPWVTAVGGTSLKVGSGGNRNGEFGWSTGKQVLCTGGTTTNCGSATKPAGDLLFNAGDGVGTSYLYPQPTYQANVVPNALATRNAALNGTTPFRVIPDISLDADAQTGMLIGLTETFPDGVRYGQFKEGGTSLASPLLAGVVADADQAAGGSVGFLNPVLYKIRKESGAIRDILPPPDPNSAATVRVDYANTVDASDGYAVSLRVLDYEGPETYCDGAGNCATRDVTVNAAHGYDGLTGLGSPGLSFVSDLAKQ